MTSTVLINNSRMEDLGLTLEQEYFLAWFNNFAGSGTMEELQKDGKTFFWVALQKAIDDLPGLTRDKSNLSKMIKTMIEKGIFEKQVCNGSKLYLRQKIGDKKKADRGGYGLDQSAYEEPLVNSPCDHGKNTNGPLVNSPSTVVNLPNNIELNNELDNELKIKESAPANNISRDDNTSNNANNSFFSNKKNKNKLDDAKVFSALWKEKTWQMAAVGMPELEIVAEHISKRGIEYVTASLEKYSKEKDKIDPAYHYKTILAFLDKGLDRFPPDKQTNADIPEASMYTDIWNAKRKQLQDERSKDPIAIGFDKLVNRLEGKGPPQYLSEENKKKLDNLNNFVHNMVGV